MKLVRKLDSFFNKYAVYWPIPFIGAAWAAWWLTDTKAGAPFRDIELEFAGTRERADAILAVFDVDMVRSTLIRDFAFLVFVFIGLAMVVRWVRDQFRTGFWNDAGGVLMWASVGAGLFDIIENLALLGYLGDWFSLVDHWPAVAIAATGLKWSIVVFAAIYVLIGLALALFRKVGSIPPIHPIERDPSWPDRDGEWGDPAQHFTGVRRGSDDEVPAVAPEPEGEEVADQVPVGPQARMEQALDSLNYKAAADHLEMLVDEAKAWAPEQRNIAICCSGGGVRSATFSLGALQELAKAGTYADARYLIAISGGSYIASAHAMLDSGRSVDEIARVPSFQQGSPEAHHLRNNSNYLAPTTPSQYLAIGRILIGLVMTLAFVASLLLLVGRPWGALVASDGLYPEIALGFDGLAAAAGNVDDAASAIADLVSIESSNGETEVEIAEAVPVGLSELAGELAATRKSLEERIDELSAEDDAAMSAEFAAATARLIDNARAVERDTRDIANDCANRDRACASRGLRGADLAALHQDSLALSTAAGAYEAEAQRLARPPIPFGGGWWPIATALLATIVCGTVAISVRQVAHTPARQSNWTRGAGLFLAATAFLLLTLVVLPFVFVRGPDWIVDQGKTLFAAVEGLGSAAMLAAALSVLMAKRSSLPASIVGGLVAPLLALIAIINFAGAGARAGSLQKWGWGDAAIMGAAAAVYLVVAARADLTTWSLHPFYRRRLSIAYALERLPDGKVKSIAPGVIPMSELAGGRPELLICAAANINDVGFAPAGRQANSFTFSPRWIHIPNLALVRTDLMESLGETWRHELSVQGAVAISGAAASPSMGKNTRPAVRALLALANVRLGVWLPNPLFVAELEGDPAAAGYKDKYFKKVPASYLLKEILGLHRARDRFLYVSDGGHWENLGLVEALRRGCTEIYVFDASGDQPDMFTTLGEALAIARMEKGVEVDLRLDALSIRAQQQAENEEPHPIISPADHIVHGFEYIHDDGTTTPGTIIYCKAAVTSDAPPDVIAYQEKHPAFPSDPTLADQFFDHEQFEAYRALGSHVAGHAVATMRRKERLEADGFVWSGNAPVWEFDI